jgi:hypothetical protein
MKLETQSIYISLRNYHYFSFFATLDKFFKFISKDIINGFQSQALYAITEH